MGVLYPSGRAGELFWIEAGFCRAAVLPDPRTARIRGDDDRIKDILFCPGKPA